MKRKACEPLDVSKEFCKGLPSGRQPFEVGYPSVSVTQMGTEPVRFRTVQVAMTATRCVTVTTETGRPCESTVRRVSKWKETGGGGGATCFTTVRFAVALLLCPLTVTIPTTAYLPIVSGVNPVWDHKSPASDRFMVLVSPERCTTCPSIDTSDTILMRALSGILVKSTYTETVSLVPTLTFDTGGWTKFQSG